ncbi:hypothetical protein AC801_09385 [Xanthomonas sp. ISO98C4]|nr:hypothetical protein AC801_09385 [Xanthomonas sp. ISO98C4]
MGRLAADGGDFALLVSVHRSKAAVAGATLVAVLICHCRFSFAGWGVHHWTPWHEASIAVQAPIGRGDFDSQA